MKEKLFDNPKTVTLTIEQGLYDELKVIAKDNDLLVGPFIRKVIKNYIKEQEKGKVEF
jgi:predicted DNA-binding ribbon-helix-helix protein